MRKHADLSAEEYKTGTRFDDYGIMQRLYVLFRLAEFDDDNRAKERLRNLEEISRGADDGVIDGLYVPVTL